jgi:hypothetical protein
VHKRLKIFEKILTLLKKQYLIFKYDKWKTKLIKTLKTTKKVQIKEIFMNFIK